VLETIPGAGHPAATALLAEIGADMSRCASAGHRACWAGVCPGNKHRGGERLSGKTRPGNPWLRGILGAVAGSIAHPSDTARAAPYLRLAYRRRKRTAIVAVARPLLAISSRLLRDQRPDRDLGADSCDHVDTTRLQRHDVHRLEQHGYALTRAPSVVA
jgi:transposase